MKSVFTTALLGLLLLPLQGHTQTSLRLRAMGDPVVAVPDSERGLNPYDVASNPAWLLRDEQHDRLRIQPSYSNTRGSYRRLYDPGEVTVYGAGSDGVRTLGEAGTFRGGVVYAVEKRRGVYRSLKRDPYTGEAFFLKDTTTGDVTYNGPAVWFQYAYELFPDVILGASVEYQILDGLKYRYSNTKSLWRDMRGTLGVTVEPAGGLVAGVVYSPGSAQERLEAKSDDLLDVELTHLRGETFAIRQRGGTVNHKVKTATHEFGAHLFWTASAGATLGLDARYGIGRKQILLSREIEKDVEDGFETFEETEGRVFVRMDLPAGLVGGGYAGLERRSDWSRHTPRDLLLWKWGSRSFFAGAGISGVFAGGLLVAATEYEYRRATMDSSRYIDNRFQSITPVCHTLRLGIEVRPAAGMALRGGCSSGVADYDLLINAGRVRRLAFTCGAWVELSSTAALDAVVEYGDAGTSALRRRTVGADIRLTLTMP